MGQDRTGSNCNNEKSLSGLWSGFGCEAGWGSLEENYYRRKKNINVQSKKILYLTTCSEKPMLRKKKKKTGRRAGGCNFSLVHMCKYQENEVRLKCILNILNF